MARQAGVANRRNRNGYNSESLHNGRMAFCFGGLYFALGVAIVKPVLQALVLADRVYSDGVSGKKIIAGTFSRMMLINREAKPDEPSLLKVPAGGMQAGSPFAYISITDVHREAKLTLRYVQLKEAQPEVVFQVDSVRAMR